MRACSFPHAIHIHAQSTCAVRHPRKIISLNGLSVYNDHLLASNLLLITSAHVIVSQDLMWAAPQLSPSPNLGSVGRPDCDPHRRKTRRQRRVQLVTLLIIKGTLIAVPSTKDFFLMIMVHTSDPWVLLAGSASHMLALHPFVIIYLSCGSRLPFFDIS